MNNEKLKKIMEKNKLTVIAVAELLDVSQNRVYSWRTSAHWKRNVPDQMLDLLQFKLKNKEIKW